MKYLISLLLIVILACCKEKYGNKQQEKIDLLFKKYKQEIALKEQSLIILPLYGNREQLIKAVYFMKKENRSPMYKFVLSYTSNTDKLRINLSNEICADAIVFDTIDFAGNRELVFNSPVAYFVKDSLQSITLETDQDYDELQVLRQKHCE